jgi:hypothetical protein
MGGAQSCAEKLQEVLIKTSSGFWEEKQALETKEME